MNDRRIRSDESVGRQEDIGRLAPIVQAGLTDSDREVIERARELGPVLRASGSDRDRLAGWLLKELADLAERLAAST